MPASIMISLSTPLSSVLTIVNIVLITSALPIQPNAMENNASYWIGIGREELSRALNRQRITKRAKNVILFVGDGMSASTVTAARIYHGQRLNKTGEEGLLFFETFQHIAHTKTYSVDKQTPDSAATATSFLCGVKNNYGTIGVDATVIRSNCSSQAGHELTSILHWSQRAGKHVGIVTNTRVTHATPAAAYASAASRDWEGDSNMADETTRGCKDIARQLVEDNPDVRVILGGGRCHFLPSTVPDPETGEININKRQDGRNLVEEWLADKQERNFSAQYVWNASSLFQLHLDSTDFLLGLFDDNHMDYEFFRTPTPVEDEAGEPSLADMTSAAITMLSKAEQGFFLFVEGGRIDHAHHSNRAKLSLVETEAFDMAVRTAAEMTSIEDTLLVVTADHSHVFVISGYPSRGNSITGEEDINLGSDSLPYTTLLYGNGPGYTNVQGKREDITHIDVEDVLYRQQAAVPLASETHAGEDVAVYSQGPMAHLFHATHEQSYLAYVMAFASCVGVFQDEADCAAALEKSTSLPDRHASTSVKDANHPKSPERKSVDCITNAVGDLKPCEVSMSVWVLLGFCLHLL